MCFTNNNINGRGFWGPARDHGEKYTELFWGGNRGLRVDFHRADGLGGFSAANTPLEAYLDALESSDPLLSHKCYEML